MKLGQAFPSNFLKADDLQGKNVTVTIETVQMEDIGQDKDSKLVLAFTGKSKKMVCNKTNATTIGKLYGEETDNWLGKPITLCAREVEFQGETVWAIRVSLQKPPGNTAMPPSHALAPAQPSEPEESGVGDHVPF